MMKDNNLVRHLDACETMGNATSICSDKTGTLTTNRMTCVQQYINREFCRHSTIRKIFFADQFYKGSVPKYESLDPATRDFLFNGIVINSGYSSTVVEPKNPGEQRGQIGNKTECSLFGFIIDSGRSYEDLRKQFPEEKLFKVFTFNSSRKSMMTVIELGNGKYRIYAKGASEIILTRCRYIFGKGGRIELFGQKEASIMTQNVIEPMASDGLRTIGLAFKDLVPAGTKKFEYEEEYEGEIDWDDEEKIREGQTVIAVMGIQDPVRPEVPAAIAKCQKAGITVRMVTGDNINTARSIATQCGIMQPGADFLALEGKDFNARIRDADGKVNQQKLDQVWPKLRVLARAQPSDKYVLVKGIIDSKNTKNRFFSNCFQSLIGLLAERLLQ